MKRFVELDILRFFAASWVALYHFAPRVAGIRALEPVSFWGILSRFGYMGVDMFFIISGFVILLSTRNRNWNTFLAQRFIRLFPSYWVALLITIVATATLTAEGFPSYSRIAANLTMLPGYMGSEPINPVIWTLAVEWKFYFLITLLLASPLRSQMEAVAYVWIVVLGVQFAGLDFGPLRSISMFPYGTYFAYGMLLYVIYEFGLTRKRVLFAVAGVIFSAVTALRVRNGFIPVPSPTDSLATVVFITAICVGFLALVVKPYSMSPSQTVRILGATTYPLYLLHGGLGYPLFSDTRISSHAPTRAVLSIAIVLLFSAAMAWTIEIKFVSWVSRKLTLRTRPLPEAL